MWLELKLAGLAQSSTRYALVSSVLINSSYFSCQEYTMDQVAQVHHDIVHSKGAKGKLVLRVADE